MKNRTIVVPENHDQYLVAINLLGGGRAERCIYRIPLEAKMVDVIRTAVNRSELVGEEVRCSGIEILGIIEPHLRPLYVPLLAKEDFTDMIVEEQQGDGVYCIRQDDVFIYRVRYGGKICTPTWTDKGPAQAYLSMLRKGRKPEYSNVD